MFNIHKPAFCGPHRDAAGIHAAMAAGLRACPPVYTLYIYIYVCIYIYIHTYIHMFHIYIYRERERERDMCYIIIAIV